LHVAELERDRLKALQVLLSSLLRYFHFRTRRLFQTQNQRKWDLCFKTVWPLGIEVSQFPDVHADVFFPIQVSPAVKYGGALFGFLSGVLFLRNFEKKPWKFRIRICAGLCLALLICLTLAQNVKLPELREECAAHPSCKDLFMN